MARARTFDGHHRGLSHGHAQALSSRIFAAEILYAYYSREDVRLYREQRIGGAGAAIVDLQQRLPSNTVVVSLPNEQPAYGRLLKAINIPYHDDWGRLKQRQVYLIWLVE